MPRKSKRAFFRPNGIYFLSPLAVGALMTGAVIPTPSIIETVNKTAKIGDSCKITHSKHYQIDKFSSVCKNQFIRCRL
ncbi:MAG: hypothetical protein IKA10_04965 [Oscillospiraceae bacterium]|nr:hypothetical protein [Oscillospiraceae bacterium]